MTYLFSVTTSSVRKKLFLVNVKIRAWYKVQTTRMHGFNKQSLNFYYTIMLATWRKGLRHSLLRRSASQDVWLKLRPRHLAPSLHETFYGDWFSLLGGTQNKMLRNSRKPWIWKAPNRERISRLISSTTRAISSDRKINKYAMQKHHIAQLFTTSSHKCFRKLTVLFRWLAAHYEKQGQKGDDD